TQVGVGMATFKKDNGQVVTYVVARYTPQGNVHGRYLENVLPEKEGGKNLFPNMVIILLLII
ncbi:hypothetical protein, partial [Acinetobacter baumannii]|uniref:hypothetical protein n=1 Tax=Acinetobacter baumannii TaxID=470 RepID=UPI001C070B94